jgi:hypothetical protein
VESKGNETDFLRRLSGYEGISVLLSLGLHFIQGSFVSNVCIRWDKNRRIKGDGIRALPFSFILIVNLHQSFLGAGEDKWVEPLKSGERGDLARKTRAPFLFIPVKCFLSFEAA